MPTPCLGPKAWVPSVTQAKARLECGLAGGGGEGLCSHQVSFMHGGYISFIADMSAIET